MLNDLRYTARLLRKSPLFTIAVVLTVALGIGANTAIFSVVNAVMLRPLPFAEPDRLYWVAERNDTLNLPTFSASVLNYVSWKAQARAFEQLGAAGFASFNLTGRGDPEQFTGSPITPSLLPLLGIQPVAGRAFRDDEDRPGAARVAMIGEGLWKRRFGGDPALVGSSLTLNGVDTLVVGIAPPSLALLTSGDIWVPLTIDPGRENRLNHVITVVGRLRRGVTIEQAQAEMDVVASRVGAEYPDVKDWGVRLVTFYNFFVQPQLQTALVVLLGAVACVLLIASANVANLLLSRAASRQKEIAVRTAMGASRRRLIRQMLVESLALSSLGGALGILGAMWAVDALGAVMPPNLLPVPDIHVDTTVLLFALAATVATGILFGLAPAWQASRTDLNDVLKQAGRGSSAGARPLLRNSLAAAELALATMLLIGAGLLGQSLLRLQHVPLGFQPDRLLTFQVALPQARYRGEMKAAMFYGQLVDALRTLPGVRDAAVSSGIPFGVGNYTTTPIATSGGPSPLAPETAVPTDWRIVSPGFFRTMEIPLLRGREFTNGDGPNAPQVVVVSQATARRFFGDTDPLGRRMHRVADSREFAVVGVVGDVRHTTLNQESPAIYYPSTTGRVWPLMDVVVRTAVPPESILAGVRTKIRELDSELPISNVRPMAEWVSNNAAQPRLNAILLSVFAAVALLIAAIGIYGVLAYSVNQRTREIGLRMALGSPRGRVLGLIVREGMLVGLAGIGIGVAGALGLSRALASLVFGVAVRDPITFVLVAGMLSIVALAACVIPARTASRVDPMVALRYD
jgi:putative ABC transport system permease protein